MPVGSRFVEKSRCGFLPSLSCFLLVVRAFFLCVQGVGCIGYTRRALVSLVLSLGGRLRRSVLENPSGCTFPRHCPGQGSPTLTFFFFVDIRKRAFVHPRPPTKT